MSQTEYAIAQFQSILLEFSLLQAASEAKEYKEDWRKNPVLRQGGRFASSVQKGAGDVEQRVEQSVKKALNATNQRIDQIKASLAKLGESAQGKLRTIFQSAPMDEARAKIGDALEEVSPEAREAFDDINDEISSALSKGDDLEAALTKGQNQAMDGLKKALASMGNAIKERKAGLLAMGTIAALTATAGGAGLLIGAGAVGTVANWTVPNVLGRAKEFATTKAILEDDKNLFKVWGAEFNAEVSQFLFRASLLAAGAGILVLGEELAFDALEEDKRTFAQGVKVLTQDAIAGISGDPSLGASEEDKGKLGEYFRESSNKRLGG